MIVVYWVGSSTDFKKHIDVNAIKHVFSSCCNLVRKIVELMNKMPVKRVGFVP